MSIFRIFFSVTKWFSLGVSSVFGQTQDCGLVFDKITEHTHLIAFWDFEERSDSGWVSVGGTTPYTLREVGNITQVKESPLSDASIQLDGHSAYLYLPNELSEGLSVQTNQVTLVAWVKWEGGTGFVAGKWNEHDNGGLRQYGLFISLPYYNGGDQVCGHISQIGGPTDPFPYSIDYSASKQRVPQSEWVCVGFTYDGMYIKSYVNGVFESREPELINRTAGFLKDKPQGIIHSKNPYFYPYGIGNNQSDFTVGAVQLKSGMGNFFKGKMSAIAVFDQALSADEMARLAATPIPPTVASQ